MRVIFMGTPYFAVPTLKALIAAGHEVVAVYSQPPRPSGRGMRVTPSPVHHLAEEHHIPVFTPESLKAPEVQAQFSAHSADIAVVAAYGLLLPKAILEAPRFGCINIHPSELPRWRGAAPIQRTIMAGDRHTECCIMQMAAGLDTGDVLDRHPYIIPALMTAGELHDIMAEMGATQVVNLLPRIEAGTAQAVPQSAEGVTYADKILKIDRIIEWAQPASHILNRIRGLSPNPAAITVLHGEIVKIFHAQEEEGDPDKPPGYVLDDLLLINAKGGSAVRLLELQRPSKSRQSNVQFTLGFEVKPGVYAKNPIL